MKINRLDAHDRFSYLMETQSQEITECCEDLIKKRPFGDRDFYIFAHPRTEDDGSNKRLIWQPRILKPSAQTNSMLFRADILTGDIDVIWIIPPVELWDSYIKNNLTESCVVSLSIDAFKNDRAKLEAPHPDDPPQWKAMEILFDYYPLLFKRDSLPDDKKHKWDKAKADKVRSKGFEL